MSFVERLGYLQFGRNLLSFWQLRCLRYNKSVDRWFCALIFRTSLPLWQFIYSRTISSWL